jgi:four helix bundle protein
MDTMPMNQFDHDKLDVYHLAIDFYATADPIIDGLPKGRSKLADQLGRAALSISANIAEGAGEFSGDAKASFYRIASRSATECAAILDACNKVGIADVSLTTKGREMLLRIVSMLIKLCKRHAT